MTEYARGFEIGSSVRRVPVYKPDTDAGDDVTIDVKKQSNASPILSRLWRAPRLKVAQDFFMR